MAVIGFASSDYDSEILDDKFLLKPDSSYKYKFKTTNIIQVEQEGDGRDIVEGSYSYVSVIWRHWWNEWLNGNCRSIPMAAHTPWLTLHTTGDDIHPSISAVVDLVLKNPETEELNDFYKLKFQWNLEDKIKMTL